MTSSSASRTRSADARPAQQAAGPPPHRLDRRVIWVALALFAILMALSPWYGFDRDELYFLDCARHLQAAYVDQPILTPLLARISLDLFGVSLPGLRLWPALAGAATVIVAALTARELGGGKRAQLLSAFATATMPALLAVDHLMGPTAIDLLAWSALALVVLRLGRTGNRRWWLAAGAVCGVGLANKHSIAFFAAALLLGLLVTGDRRLLSSRWLAIGTAIAVMFTIPDLWWQATHGWATITMTRNLNAENGGAGKIPTWVAGQLLMTSLALVPVWIAGLRWLWRTRAPAFRSLVVAYGVLFVLFALTTGGKIYYLAGAYVPLLAAGALAIDGWLAARRHLRTLVVGMVVTVGAALPVALPVLPASNTAWVYKLNQVPGESVGWPELVHTVAAAWHQLPEGARRSAVVITANYGEVGALNELGRGQGIPLAYSDQNSEWWWGPGNPHAHSVLFVAPGPRDMTDARSYLLRFFASVRPVATLRNSAGIHNQEWGGHVYWCTRLRRPWAATWPLLRHYD